MWHRLLKQSTEGRGAFGAGGPGLQHTAVAHCQLVSDGGHGALDAGGPGVQHTAVAHFHFASDRVHWALGAGGPCSELTAVAHCQSVSAKGHGALGAGGPGLQHTVVSPCSLHLFAHCTLLIAPFCPCLSLAVQASDPLTRSSRVLRLLFHFAWLARHDSPSA